MTYFTTDFYLGSILVVKGELATDEIDKIRQWADSKPELEITTTYLAESSFALKAKSAKKYPATVFLVEASEAVKQKLSAAYPAPLHIYLNTKDMVDVADPEGIYAEASA